MARGSYPSGSHVDLSRELGRRAPEELLTLRLTTRDSWSILGASQSCPVRTPGAERPNPFDLLGGWARQLTE